MVKPPLRTKSIGFKVSEEEYALLETAAQASGRTFAECCRDSLPLSVNVHTLPPTLFPQLHATLAPAYELDAQPAPPPTPARRNALRHIRRRLFAPNPRQPQPASHSHHRAPLKKPAP
jgi:hypothetical protein